MKKSLFVLFGLMSTALLAGCTTKNLWDMDYDLTNEIGRQLHCFAQFQKDHPMKNGGTRWVPEFEYEGDFIVEGNVKTDKNEYNLVCRYNSEQTESDPSEWTLWATPVEEKQAKGDPYAEFCNEQGGEFEIVSDDENIYGQCMLPNGMVCESWKYYNGECPSEDDEYYSNYYGEYVKKSLTNEDIEHIEEILPPISYEYEIWNMEDETLVESGHYVYPNDLENGYVFIPEHATMASREIKSSAIQDGMIYTDSDVTLQDGTVISVLYIHEPDTLFCRAITVENGNQTTYYKNFFYSYDQ